MHSFIEWSLIPGFLFFGGPALAAVSTLEKTTTIAVLDDGAAHQEKVDQTLKVLLKNCHKCKIKFFPIYEKNGDLKASRFIQALDQAATKADIINLSWNLPSTELTAAIEKKLNEVAEKKIIFASAGAPSGPGKLTAPLAGTVIGKIKNIFIVGELNSQGHLALNSYYGPEMFTALTPPAGTKGSSFSVLMLTAAAGEWLAKNKKSIETSTIELRKTLLKNKKKTGSSYPSLPDLLQISPELFSSLPNAFLQVD